MLTEDRPAHHPHQTGLYWGFTRLNGRDYFHNPGADYWRRVSATVLQAGGRRGALADRLRPARRERRGGAHRDPALGDARAERRFQLDLIWRGEAKTDVTIGKYDYGGLFLRMPWREGINGEVVNAARQRNARAEGQRAMWVDVAMQVDGRDDLAHIAIFDHPDNGGYPQTWRVDDQLGFGPARSRTADWTIPPTRPKSSAIASSSTPATLDDVEMTTAWKDYSGNRRPIRPPRCGASRSTKAAQPRCSRRRRPRRT